MKKYNIGPTLFIGLGGTGRIALMELKKNLMQKGLIRTDAENPLLQFLCIDTEFLSANEVDDNDPHKKTLEYIDKEYHDIQFSSGEVYSIAKGKTDLQGMLREPHKSQASDFVASKEKIGPIIKDAVGYGAAGIGLIGKISLWPNLDVLKGQLETKIQDLLSKDYINNIIKNSYKNILNEISQNNGIMVFVICSVGGGTGKGTFLTVAALIRHLIRSQSKELSDHSFIKLVNFMPSCFKMGGRDVGEKYFNTIQANQYASFKELEHILKNGYQFEENISKKIFSSTTPITVEDVYTHIWNVSNWDDEHRSMQTSYSSINKLVSETIFNFVFSGKIHDIITKGYHANPAGSGFITEIEAPNAKRQSNYGRIGGFSLKLPKSKLVSFSKLYYKKLILDDIVTGKLYPNVQNERIDGEYKANKSSDIAESFANQLPLPKDYPSIKISKASYNALSYEDQDKIFDSISKNLSGAYDAYALKYQGNNGKISSRDEEFERQQNLVIESLKVRLKEGIKDHGIVFAEKIITELNEDIINRIASVFEKFEHINQITGKLKESSDNTLKKKLISSILDFFNQEIETTVQELKPNISSNPPWEITLKEALANDKLEWIEENDTFWKKIGAGARADKKLSLQSRAIISNIFIEVEKILPKLYNYSEYITYLKSTSKIIDKLNEIGLVLTKNRLNIYDESNSTMNNCLVKSIKQQMADVLRGNTTDLVADVISSTPEQYTHFAESLRIGVNSIENELQNWLNKENGLIDQLVDKEVTKSDFIDEIDRLSEMIFNNKAELKLQSGVLLKDYTLSKFLDGLSDLDKDEFIQKRLSTSGSALGALDLSKIGNIKTESQVILISGNNLDDVTIGKMRKLIKPEPIFVENFDPEIIQITRVSRGLPLTVYSELQKAKIIYDQIVKENGREVKYRFHTHKHFIDIDEPMGNSNQIPNEDFATYVNLLVHTGVIHVISQASNNAGDIGKVQELVESTTYDKYDFYEDKLKIALPKDQRKVSWDDFIRYLKNDNVYFTHFTEKLIERFNSIFEISKAKKRVAALEHLKKYFKEDKFPYIPEMVLRYIINSNKTSPALKSLIQADELDKQNSAKIAKFRNSKRGDKIKLFKDGNDWGNYYDPMNKRIYLGIDEEEVFDLKDVETGMLFEGYTKDKILIQIQDEPGIYLVRKHYSDKPEVWEKLDKDTFFKDINRNGKHSSLDVNANPTRINISEKTEIKKYPFVWKDNTGKMNTTSLTLDELKEFIIDNGINKEDVRVSEKGKPSKNDWTTPDEIPEIKDIFDSIQNPENDGLDFELPDF